MNGKVYTETVIYSAPEAFVKDVPYQIAIVTLADGRRITARILEGEVSIDDPVHFAEERNGVPYFRKADK